MARLQFSNAADRTGIIQLIERDTGTQSTTTSSYPLKVKTVDVNEALSNFMLLAIKASGKAQVDDTNQPDYPILYVDLVNGQQDIVLIYDGSTIPNQILDFYTIRVKDTNGNYKLVEMLDRQVDDITQYDGQYGVPEKYDLTADGVIFYPTPNYDSDDGVELYVARNAHYFVSTDTIKVPGIPEPFHAYLHLRPSYLYCLLKGLPQATKLGEMVEKMEKAIEAYFSRRVKTEKPALRVRQESTR